MLGRLDSCVHAQPMQVMEHVDTAVLERRCGPTDVTNIVVGTVMRTFIDVVVFADGSCAGAHMNNMNAAKGPDNFANA